MEHNAMNIRFKNTESWVAYTLAISDPNHPKLDKNLWYKGKDSIWSGGVYYGETPLGESWGIVYTYAPNVADTLEDSNWQCILADLEKNFGPEGDNWVWEKIGHWVTPLQYLMIRLINDNGAPSEAAEWFFDVLLRLDDYPVYNEDHWSELEYETVSSALFDETKYALRNSDYADIDPDSLIAYARTVYYRTYETYHDRWYEAEGYPDKNEVIRLAELYCQNQAGIPALLAYWGI